MRRQETLLFPALHNISGLSDSHKTLNYTKSVALEATIPHFQGQAERCLFREKV